MTFSKEIWRPYLDYVKMAFFSDIMFAFKITKNKRFWFLFLCKFLRPREFSWTHLTCHDLKNSLIDLLKVWGGKVLAKEVLLKFGDTIILGNPLSFFSQHLLLTFLLFTFPALTTLFCDIENLNLVL